MRDLASLESWRVRGDTVRQIIGTDGDHRSGLFVATSPVDGGKLIVVASTDGGWDHVSVSRKNRVPNWREMEHIFRMFFLPAETAMQLHVPEAEHINNHPFCLHIWRPIDQPIPKPPAIMVGIGQGPIKSPADALERLRQSQS